jgi:ATP-dependent RNA helicase DeaD
MGFAEDLELILSELPENRQTALFSATMAPRIATIANEHLDNPIRVTIAPRAMDEGTVPKIRQAAYVVRRELKEAALIRLLDVEAPSSALIFCRTRIEVEALTESLGRRGLLVSALHGGMTQEQRDITLRRFKGGELKFLIATDVAARGLHVENLSHVINYDLPVSPEPYVHRIGRTGRAGHEGVALSLLDPRELRLLKNIERTTRTKIPMEKLPGVETLRKKREAVLADLVRAGLQPANVESMKGLLAELTKGTTLEAVAASALLVAMQRLFPPTDGDEVDFAASAAPRRAYGDDDGPRARASGRDGRGPARRDDSEGPRGRAAPFERKPYAGADKGRAAPFERKPYEGKARTPAAARSEPSERKPFLDEAAVAAPRARVSAPRASASERKPTAAEEAEAGPRARVSAPRAAGSSERKPFTGDEEPKAARKDPAERKPSAGADEPARKDPAERKPYAADAARAERKPYDKVEPRRPPRDEADVVTLFIGLGARAGLRPQDVVGAIANEAGISSRDIGNIVIGDEHSRVQVPKDAAPEVINALRQTTLRGRKFSIDLDRAAAGPRAAPSAAPEAPAAGGFRKERFVGAGGTKPPRLKR